MGSLPGHLLPGSMFFVFAIWQIVGHLYNHFDRRRRNKVYKASYCMQLIPCSCFKSYTPLPIEGYLKLFLTAFGMLAEAIGSIWHNMVILQHITMYAAFFLAGVVDLLLFYKIRAVPKGMDYVAHALGFVVEGLLFMHHLHGRPPVDVTVHTLIVYVCFATTLFYLINIPMNKSILLALSRNYLLMVQGTWFMHVGFILYPPVGEKMDLKSPMNVMLVVNYLTWHMILAFVVVIGICLVCQYRFGSPEYSLRSRKMESGFSDYMLVHRDNDVNTDLLPNNVGKHKNHMTDLVGRPLIGRYDDHDDYAEA